MSIPCQTAQHKIQLKPYSVGTVPKELYRPYWRVLYNVGMIKTMMRWTLIFYNS